MKLLATVLLLLVAVPAFAGTIIDLQTGAYTVGAEVVVNGAVVTGVRYNGFFMTEDPNAPYAGVWVFTSAAPGVAVGQLVNVAGLYEEYYSFTEINVFTDPTGYVTVLGEHMGAIYPLPVTVADLAADAEPYEGCFIMVTDGMVVTTAPNSYGEWQVESYESPGQFLWMDDYWYDDTTVQLGDCYNSATGMLAFSFGTFRLEPIANAICLTDCTVGNEDLSFGEIKALFR